MAFLVDQVIPSVRLIRTGLRRDGMFLISSNGLALWFATTGCWRKPDSRFEKESCLPREGGIPKKYQHTSKLSLAVESCKKASRPRSRGTATPRAAKRL